MEIKLIGRNIWDVLNGDTIMLKRKNTIYELSIMKVDYTQDL